LSRAVLLVGFGGPERPDEVRPFLDDVLRGRPVPKERYEEVVRQYERIGGASPYNAQTARFAAALERRLRETGAPWPVSVGLRHSRPTLEDALRRLAGAGVREAAAVVLSTFRSEPSWDRYRAAADRAAAAVGPAAPRLAYADSWAADDLFIGAVADRVREAGGPLAAGERLVFTAHSIPVALDRDSDYSGQFRAAAARVAAAVGATEFSCAFQSRSGRPEDPWLEPDVGDELRRLASAGAGSVRVVPLGFLSDHVEVLFDLDVKARAAADAAGLPFRRAATVGDHPDFVRAVADRARAALEGAARV
jgi:ferrochelatase